MFVFAIGPYTETPPGLWFCLTELAAIELIEHKMGYRAMYRIILKSGFSYKGYVDTNDHVYLQRMVIRSKDNHEYTLD